jgi:hypothetical protein
MIQRVWCALLLLLVAGCAKDGDVGDMTKRWTDRENELFVKLNNVKAEYATLRSRLTARGATTVDDASRNLEERLRVNETSVRELEDLLGRHRDARARGIQGGDAEAMETLWNSAEADYKGAMAKLDVLEAQRKEIDGDIGRLPKVDAGVRIDNDRTTDDIDRKVDRDRDTAIVVPNSKVDDVVGKDRVGDGK